MRSFPRAVRRRVGVAALAVSLAAGVAVVPSVLPSSVPSTLASAQAGLAIGDRSDRLEKRQKRIESRLEHAHEDFEMSSRRVVRATRALEAARSELRTARHHLATTRDDLDAARAKDVEMQAELAQAQADLDYAELAVVAGTAAVGRQRDAVAAIVSDIYTDGDPDLLAFASMFGAQSPADLIRGQEGQRAIVATQTQAYTDLSAAEVDLKAQERQVGDARDEVARQAKAAAEHLELVTGLEAQARQARDEVVRLVGERKHYKRQTQKFKKWDRFQLKKVEREDARVERQLRELARKARLRALRRAQANAGPPGDSGGFLNQPVPGPVTSSFGMRVHPIYGYWALHDGTDFGVACGEPMYAAADGRVLSRYYQTAYGNRLIVDHGFQRGVGLATIYNHAASYTVSPGDQVTRGQVIGYVGNTGWSTGCHLHFSVMVNGRAVDPMTWL